MQKTDKIHHLKHRLYINYDIGIVYIVYRDGLLSVNKPVKNIFVTNEPPSCSVIIQIYSKFKFGIFEEY